MILECPHCYATVMPRGDGQCPACQKNVNDVAGADLTKAVLTIFESDHFPPICYVCGQPTDRSVSHRFEEKVDEASWGWTVFGLLFMSLGKLIQGLNGFWFRRRLSISLPQCGKCPELATPRRIDFAEGEVELLVHRAFRDGVKTMRAKREET